MVRSTAQRTRLARATPTRSLPSRAAADGVDMSQAILASSYLTKTISDASSVEGADFSEAVLPSYTQKALCARADAKGTNAATGVDTRESLMCPD